MKNLSIKKLEEICEKIQFPEIQSLGNGLYKIIPENIICGEKFLKKVNGAILDYIKEYNIDTSTGHPTSEGDDIVRHSSEKRRIQDKEPIYNKCIVTILRINLAMRLLLFILVGYLMVIYLLKQRSVLSMLYRKQSSLISIFFKRVGYHSKQEQCFLILLKQNQ